MLGLEKFIPSELQILLSNLTFPEDRIVQKFKVLKKMIRTTYSRPLSQEEWKEFDSQIKQLQTETERYQDRRFSDHFAQKLEHFKKEKRWALGYDLQKSLYF